MPGYKMHCYRCGHANWYEINELDSIVKCKGCGESGVIETDLQMHYRLNTLIENCYYDQGILPVLLVLGQLRKQSTDYFRYICSQDVFEDGNTECLTDLDIVCIKDGKLILGEVKKSHNQFSAETFQKYKDIAYRIRPNAIIFSSFDNILTDGMKNEIDNIKADLLPLNINVEWYCLDEELFKPTVYFGECKK